MHRQEKSFFDDILEREMTPFRLARTIFEEMEVAAREIGYFEEDDEFDYDMAFMREEEVQLTE